MRTLLLIILAFTASLAYAQKTYEIKGIITDTSGQALPGVSIKLIYGKDSTQALTNTAGSFSFKINTDSFVIVATHSGLETYTNSYQISNNKVVFHITPVIMAPAIGEMEGIVVQSVKPVIVKEDTVQYAASAYKVREGAAVEEVIKKLPGITVDNDGNIEAQGKKVAHVRVNGKDFFGGDVQAALEGLPADIIDNIQVIDDYGDAANLSGVKSGEPRKIININIQKRKNKGTSANFMAAAGNKGRYVSNANVNNFLGERQISFQATVGNTSANMSGSGGGGRGGGRVGGSGITVTRMAGLNFRNKWGKKISVYGSYNFSFRTSTTESSTFSQDFNPQNIRITQRESISKNSNVNHRLTWNMEYAINTQNYIKISPYFSYGSSDNESNSRSETSRKNYHTLNNNQTFNIGKSPNMGGSLLFNHKFRKQGRNFNISASITYSDNDQDRNSNSAYNNIDSTFTPLKVKDTLQIQDVGNRNSNVRTNVHLSYLEPLNAKRTTFLEVNYDWNKSANESIKEVYDQVDSSGHQSRRYNFRQSDRYHYQFITNRTGISIKGHKEKYNYSIGVQSQPLTLSGTSIGKDFSTTYSNINWIPSARFVYNISKNNALTVTMDGSAREPGFLQLQPVADSSNLNNIVSGNPDLKNELNNRFSIQYNRSNTKGRSLFFNFSYDQTQDKIVTSRINNARGTGRSTSYLNTDGFYGYNGNASFTQPFDNRKYMVTLNMAANFDNNISFTDGLKNKGRNWNVRPGVVFRLDIDDVVDLSLRGNFNYYQTSTRYATHTTENKAKSFQLGLNGKNYFGNLTIGYDFSKTMNYNFGRNIKDNPSILNLFAEYRFLKRRNVHLRMQAFDLFNKYTGLTRTINETTITDSRISNLGRLFLLSVNVRLSKYGGSNKKPVIKKQ